MKRVDPIGTDADAALEHLVKNGMRNTLDGVAQNIVFTLQSYLWPYFFLEGSELG